jgi:hypothetical protein
VIESSGGRVRHAARVPTWDTTSASGPVVINNFAIKYTVYNRTTPCKIDTAVARTVFYSIGLLRTEERAGNSVCNESDSVHGRGVGARPLGDVDTLNVTCRVGARTMSNDPCACSVQRWPRCSAAARGSPQPNIPPPQETFRAVIAQRPDDEPPGDVLSSQ